MGMWSPDGGQLAQRLARPAEGGTAMSKQPTGIPRDTEAHLIARAWKDEAFRQELLRDPKAVLARELAQLQPGTTLSDSIEVRVVEETPSTRYLVLPPKPAIDSGEELTDTELKLVAAAACVKTTTFVHPDPDDPVCSMA